MGEVLWRSRGHGQRLFHGGQRPDDLLRRMRFPSEYHGNHFSVDNAQNLIHRCLLHPNGVSYTAQRPDPNEQSEFLTSTEQWFRPVNLLTGPDGMLYVVDMYRDIIEDYSAIPRHLQQLYVRSLIAGADRGRIWRIVPEHKPRRARVRSGASDRRGIGVLPGARECLVARDGAASVGRAARSVGGGVAAPAAPAGCRSPRASAHVVHARWPRPVDARTGLRGLAGSGAAREGPRAATGRTLAGRSPRVAGHAGSGARHASARASADCIVARWQRFAGGCCGALAHGGQRRQRPVAGGGRRQFVPQHGRSPGRHAGARGS